MRTFYVRLNKILEPSGLLLGKTNEAMMYLSCQRSKYKQSMRKYDVNPREPQSVLLFYWLFLVFCDK